MITPDLFFAVANKNGKPLPWHYAIASLNPLLNTAFYEDLVREFVLVAEDSCIDQPTDGENKTWGLIRSSYRNTPDYQRDGYRYSATGEGVDIYVLDSGIMIEHGEFTDETKSQGTVSFVRPTRSVSKVEKSLNLQRSWNIFRIK